MSTEHVSVEQLKTTVVFPRDAFESIEAEAKRLGLPVEAYLSAIHDVQTGRISSRFVEIAGKLFARDDAVLRELAQ